MASIASQETVDGVVKLLRNFVPSHMMRSVYYELQAIPGSRTWKDAVKQIGVELGYEPDTRKITGTKAPAKRSSTKQPSKRVRAGRTVA